MYKFLETLGDMAVDAFDFFEAMTRAGYGATSGKINYELVKLRRERERMRIANEVEQKIWRRYMQMLSRLKHEGLIEEKRKERDARNLFVLTKAGREKLKTLRERKRGEILCSPEPKNQKNNNFVIVAFDIPERERKKRDWLRSALALLGFRMVQKSVWIGRVKIPKKFLQELKDLRLIDCVEIFEVTKTGSLEGVKMTQESSVPRSQ